jgi:hypothetical protein
VALLAHASFQDRVFLALDLHEEPAGPLPPLLVKFGQPKQEPPKPGAAAKAAKPSGPAAATPPAVWLELQQGLDKQRARAGRIRVPSREEVVKRIGADKHPALWQSDILWSRVAYGYQPELTDAWFATTTAFQQEAGMDRVFASSLFWVITHSVQCFY